MNKQENTYYIDSLTDEYYEIKELYDKMKIDRAKERERRKAIKLKWRTQNFSRKGN